MAIHCQGGGAPSLILLMSITANQSDCDIPPPLYTTSKGGTVPSNARGRSDGHLTASVHHNSEGAKKELWKRSKKKRVHVSLMVHLMLTSSPKKKERQRCCLVFFFRGNSFIREKLPRAVASRTNDDPWRFQLQRAQRVLPFPPQNPRRRTSELLPQL